MSKYLYHDLDCDPDLEDPIEVEIFWHPDSLTAIAKDCAKDFWSHHDGYDAAWPRVFVIADAEGKTLGKVEVNQEDFEPVFYASVVHD